MSAVANQGSPELEAAATGLRFPPGWRELCLDWTDPGRVPAADIRPFLEPGFVERAGRDVGLTDDMIAAVAAFAARAAQDVHMVSFLRFCRNRMLNDPDFTEDWDDPWPRLEGFLGPDAGLPNVLLMLSTVPVMQENYRRLGIPADVARDTVGDLARWMESDEYWQRYRRWGIVPWIVRWLSRHWEGKVFQLKRLHFTPKRFNGRLRAYRQRGTGDLVAISDPGVRYLADGNAWGPCCGEAAGTWQSTLEETPDAVIGNPILPTGYARREPMRLAKAEWEVALSEGDPVLGIHIPTGSPMTFDDCGESFRKALEFYPRHFPAVKSRGFDTTSWLLDPVLEKLCRPDSNIVRNNRELYLYPSVNNSNISFFGRVFGWGVTDITGLPRKTSLQRIVGEVVDSGGHFHGGSCFLLNEDVDWGKQVYRGMASRLGLL